MLNKTHYVYTKEGIQRAMGLNTLGEVTRYQKEAIKKGFEPSKVLCGTEYFDLAMMQKQGFAVNYNKVQVEKQLANKKEGVSLQLKLVFE